MNNDRIEPSKLIAESGLNDNYPANMEAHFLVPYGRTRMIVFPLIRSVGLKAATASSRDATLPMFVRSRPSRTRWAISISWARSDTTVGGPYLGRAGDGH